MLFFVSDEMIGFHKVLKQLVSSGYHFHLSDLFSA